MSQRILFMSVTDPNKRNAHEEYAHQIISIKSILSILSFQTLNDFTDILNVSAFYFCSLFLLVVPPLPPNLKCAGQQASYVTPSPKKPDS